MNSTVEVNNEFSLIVDYSKSFKQAIEESRYLRVGQRIITFTLYQDKSEISEKKVEEIAKLFDFDFDKGYAIHTEDAISKMDKDGYRPATLVELLAFESTYSEWKGDKVVLAAGSTAKQFIHGEGQVGLKLMPGLHFDARPRNGFDGSGGGTDHNLITYSFYQYYGGCCCFLGIRK
jgi:hypothetical protein